MAFKNILNQTLRTCRAYAASLFFVKLNHCLFSLPWFGVSLLYLSPSSSTSPSFLPDILPLAAPALSRPLLVRAA